MDNKLIGISRSHGQPVDHKHDSNLNQTLKAFRRGAKEGNMVT